MKSDNTPTPRLPIKAIRIKKLRALVILALLGSTWLEASTRNGQAQAVAYQGGAGTIVPRPTFTMSATAFMEGYNAIADASDPARNSGARIIGCHPEDQGLQCSLEDAKFTKTRAALARGGSVDGRVTQDITVRLREVEGRLAAVQITGSKSDPVNRLTFVNALQTALNAVSPRESGRTGAPDLINLGLMDDEDGPKSSGLRTIETTLATVTCIQHAAETASVRCLVTAKRGG